MLGKND
jgi:condensin complex subunit 1